MLVAVDARTVYAPERRGTGKNLIDLYRRIAQLHPDWNFVMFRRPGSVTDDPFADCANITHRSIDIRGDRFDLWQQVRLPLAAVTTRASVLHSPANTAPSWPGVPLMVTVHDLIPLDAGVPSKSVTRWAATVGRGVKNARRVMTPSHYTKQRLIRQFGAPEEKIVVNHWAPDSACKPVTDENVLNDARRRYGLRTGQPYVFGFGAADPRKNTDRLIEAWAGLEPSIRSELGLLLVGIQEPALTRARERAQALAPEGGWSLMPFAPEADLPTLISGATTFCYPSLSEGFGLPILDAFVCGTPVITSTTTSLPEVAGDAALLVDPLDLLAIRGAISRMATDAKLRETLRTRGTEKLQYFSWDRAARIAADALLSAAER